MKKLLLLIVLAFVSCVSKENSGHPFISLNEEEVSEIRSGLGKYAIYDESTKSIKLRVDEFILKEIDVPIPKDYSGGYTHEQHKMNYKMMYEASMLYQIYDDPIYADFIVNMLNAYADLYPGLDRHPQTRSYARGKLFWQCLNEANWLVYTIQAYDNIYNYLEPEYRTYIEGRVFKPMALFLSEENPKFFNRVHNHGTWGNVAVGLTGLVMDDEYLLKISLYGLELDSEDEEIDNDGGVIREKGQEVGYWANLDQPFSPDGYYTEGPYYHRYAMYPFLTFAKAYTRKFPEENVFQYKDGLLIKAVDALINLSDEDGEFFPLNDGQKGMSVMANSVVEAVDVAYYFGDKNPELLAVAALQNKVTIDYMGYTVAKDLEGFEPSNYKKESVLLSDGGSGNQGAIAILRQSSLELVFKAAAHGLSHGHYDRLSYSLFDHGKEFLQDYGLVRFVNVEQRGGGNYLLENKTYAKQTIAHNTLVVNQKSQFDNKYKKASKSHSEVLFSSLEESRTQFISALDKEAYSGVKLKRSLALIEQDGRQYLVDVFDANSKEVNDYDLPFHLFGQWIDFSFEPNFDQEITVLGESDGYQHIWKEGIVQLDKGLNQVTLLNQGKFYTISSLNESGDELIFGRIGANDPEYNLRRDPLIIQRRNNHKSTVFFNVIELHGSYSPITESALESKSNIKNMRIEGDKFIIDLYKGHPLRIEVNENSISKL